SSVKCCSAQSRSSRGMEVAGRSEPSKGLEMGLSGMASHQMLSVRIEELIVASRKKAVCPNRIQRSKLTSIHLTSNGPLLNSDWHLGDAGAGAVRLGHRGGSGLLHISRSKYTTDYTDHTDKERPGLPRRGLQDTTAVSPYFL